MLPLRTLTETACLAVALAVCCVPAAAGGPKDKEVLVYPLFPGPLPNGYPLPYRKVTPMDMRLMTAAEKGSLQGVETALAAGASVQQRDMGGNLALHRAAERGHLACVARLASAGADINALDGDREDVLSIAVRTRNPALTRLALDLGANPAQVVSRHRGTALIYAAHLGEADTVRQLIAAGAPLNHANALGWTALHGAVMLGDGSERYNDIVVALIQAGARADLADRNGRNPLDYARARGYQNIVATLEAAPRL
ncbi:ankyrin repeat domain-containing protein [Crenobacter cavernae]|uniref:Ankyrin repeat domain-containing protein n=1 Tax=Crenobacter cavernae TaxID=2290923 RepID=A0ABY0FDR6_9NEIS|nr:ankyrin repeat domain-containing protein [Crenobacter cavernae]RXZ44381.1 ankyrin repeat domain-containing protein [Crenobacter cavernae]